MSKRDKIEYILTKFEGDRKRVVKNLITNERLREYVAKNLQQMLDFRLDSLLILINEYKRSGETEDIIEKIKNTNDFYNKFCQYILECTSFLGRMFAITNFLGVEIQKNVFDKEMCSYHMDNYYNSFYIFMERVYGFINMLIRELFDYEIRKSSPDKFKPEIRKALNDLGITETSQLLQTFLNDKAVKEIRQKRNKGIHESKKSTLSEIQDIWFDGRLFKYDTKTKIENYVMDEYSKFMEVNLKTLDFLRNLTVKIPKEMIAKARLKAKSNQPKAVPKTKSKEKSPKPTMR